jgi:hypothetical protein
LFPVLLPLFTSPFLFLFSPLCYVTLLSVTFSPLCGSFLSLFSFVISLPLLFLFLSRAGVGGIYRAKESGGVPIATLWQRLGSRALLPYHSAELVGQWAKLAGRGSLGFFIMRVHGGSGFGRACGVQGLMKKEEKNNTTFPCCTSRGRRKENSVVQNDTVLPLFFFFYMKRCRFGQNTPFHLNKAPHVNFQISPLFIFCSFQLHP